MQYLSLVWVAIPAVALCIVIARLVYAMSMNVKTGKKVREQWAEQISQLRYGTMLKRQHIDKHQLLHLIPLVEIREDLSRCESCQQVNACDKTLATENVSTADFAFCPNQQSIQEYKFAL